jgi:hypothetical protein
LQDQLDKLQKDLAVDISKLKKNKNFEKMKSEFDDFKLDVKKNDKL